MNVLLKRFEAYALLAVALSACGGFSRSMPAFPRSAAPAKGSSEDLAAAVERFYAAGSVSGAKDALAEAEDVAPDDPLTHEIAGRMALLRGDADEAWRRFYLAAATPGNPAVEIHLRELLDLPMTATQYRETTALLEDLLALCPDEEVRRIAAAYAASFRRRLDADVAGSEAALAKRGAVTHFSVASAFDNEDGQGFAVEYPPEREIDFAKEYAGTELPARWRVDVPLDHQQGLDFGDLVSPGQNVVAYALAYVRTPAEGEHRLRITTTDPLKIWVNDVLLLSEQKVDTEAVDQFVVPAVLRRGWNSILVKSCHEKGDWRFGLVVTDPRGGLVGGLVSSAEPQEVPDGPAPGPRYDFSMDLERGLGAMGTPLRRAFYAVERTIAAGFGPRAQDLAEAYLTAAPRGLFSRIEAALTAWGTDQLGRTIDLLDALIADNGDGAPDLYLRRAEYFEQQDRPDRAREELRRAIAANPDFREARRLLAESFAGESWDEEHLKARLADAARWPDDAEILWGLAAAYEGLGRQPEAEEVVSRIGESWRGASDVLDELRDFALRRDDYDMAVAIQKRLIALYPNTAGYHFTLGDILRRAGRLDEACDAYRRSRAVDDRWALPFERLAAIAYERGEEKEAVALWRESLKLNPDNHALADRLEHLAPEDESVFDALAPDAETIRKVLASAGGIEVRSGSDLVYLLDHSVEQVEMDGSSRQLVTQIIGAVNDTGRDMLTKYTLPGGRLRVREAYVIDPSGERREASSVRDGEVRFRELKVGSVVVIQFRLDSYPAGFLSRYLFRRWFFHGPGSQFEDSHYVLIAPAKMAIRDFGHGRWNRSERMQGDRRVIEYRAEKVPPLVSEPFTPPVIDLLDQVIISSIPDWDTVAGWDAALLVDAFRSTPETHSLALSLTEGAATKKEKLDALARFVMREVRYQQDYETSIAGVKPHAAPVVLQRAYGDCKDKSVLLMALAKEVGIETRFALLRTTTEGAFVKDLPSLQFNHAIVYVPAQDGFDAPFFVDATPDTLDLATLRPDSQNTWAMVIDPATNRWEFVRVPVGPANQQYTLRRTQITPVPDGKSGIDIMLTLQGPAAAAVRGIVRNTDDTKVFMSQLAAKMYPGSRVEDVRFSGESDIVRPLSLDMELTSEGAVRRQGEDVIVELPESENLFGYISLFERRLPLQTGLFLSLVETDDEVLIPDGYKVGHSPERLAIDNRFFSFERTAEESAGRVHIKLRYEEKVMTVPPEEYPEYRDAVKRIVEGFDQELVLKPAAKGKNPHARKGR